MSIFRRRLLMLNALKLFLNPIASYRCYDKTNDDSDRDIVKDLTGNGHDIRLYNFEFAEGSGYGLYQQNFNNFTALSDAEILDKSNNKITFNVLASRRGISIVHTKFNFTQFTLNVNCDGLYIESSYDTSYNIQLNYGINRIDVSSFPKNGSIIIRSINILNNITIEQIPDYQGALVSDGVDDYGLCENFPILTRDRGFTICAIREDIENDTPCALLSNGINTSSANAVFIFEGRTGDGQINSSWGSVNGTTKTSNKFSFLNSNSYNGITINKGPLAESYDNKIALFSYSTNNTTLLNKSALYAIEIYDRDLTDEEIATVKARMIAEYEAKTGDVSMSAVARYEAYDKTNEDNNRAVLEDLTGNGHDITLNNFSFSEGSGYGKYATDFNNWYNGIGVSKSNNKFTVTTDVTAVSCLYLFTDEINYDIPSFRVFISNSANKVKYRYFDSNGVRKDLSLIDGENILPMSYVTLYQGTKVFIGFVLTDVNITGDITIEQIPEYQGALVSDGVDDYGICENFPVFTKEKGYTVVALREWISVSNTSSAVFINKRNSGGSMDGAFNLEKSAGNVTNTYSFGGVITISTYINKNIDIIYQTSKKYKERIIPDGTRTDNTLLFLFSGYKGSSEFANIALYALEIYDRDLTDDEIANVKERMIRRYEEKTGNKYEEETV